MLFGACSTPQRITAHHVIAILLADLGRDAEALAEASLEPADWARLTSLAYIHNLAGRREASEDALRELIAEHGADSAVQIAAVYSARGEADEAFAWLDRALEQRDGGLTHLKCEPTLFPLHDDPRWRVLLKNAGFDD